MFSLATCHEIKTLSKSKNATNAATLSLSLSLSLSKPMSSPFISLKTCQTLVFLPLKHPKLESILVYKHPWMFFSLKSIFVMVATVTSAFFLILQAK
jgi:hypothetical protein